MTDLPTESTPGDAFEEIARQRDLENRIPRMKNVNDHDKNITEGGTLLLGSLKSGEEVNLEFYPSAEEPDPEDLTLKITEVGEHSIKALASGGSLKWEDKEVGIGVSAITPLGSMARMGVLEIGLYPELHYFDQSKLDAAEKQICEIWNEGHYVIIHGVRFDDKYFDEYRTDLTLPSPTERIHWLAVNNHFGNAKLLPGKLANFKVERPEQVELPRSQ